MNVREAVLTVDETQTNLLEQGPSLIERVARTAVAAAADADGVDRDARFPHKAFDVAREQKLLGVMIPVEFGGFGASIYDVTDICYTLGRACASTAMIYAMHQTKVACVIRHGHGIPWMETMMRRVARDQWLLASSTTEGQNGGNIRASAAAVDVAGDTVSLVRDATVISYGAEADGLVTIARRATDAAASDQVLLALAKDDYSLKRTLGWETLGMRGTCSTGFELKVDCPTDRVFPEAYDKIHAQTMTPFAHLCWSSAWAGIAAAAVTRAQAFIRKAARSSGGQMPPAAAHFTAAKMSLAKLRALIAANIEAFARAEHDERALGSLDFQSSITLLKVQASELAVETVMHAMRTAGLSGYRNDGEFTMGRHLRDVLSSPIMINNDRILANAATSTLMSGIPASLRD
ncbi:MULTISPECIES: acyl-CoA dehydrogenase family protein [Bradyrhizobium]|uniref:Acyl-CoA dehydrogenase n=1 Tax=Bradyrhizobium diazoefficiens (strain JCM 10833 / BCRC 13528 / IAM 13628 / NBRC 14792 / USDA 110) TaxID=224911 RepID=Q89VT7_BRADU|nr:acyl-CoA dehydrogenase family protein [Bradyrhizobium diazoefficiens]AND86670.1 acyl-CoA dehydrogenase [Bradyrhizobium diazoefficiens USDA 110]AWO88079.1 acyl-CoA/acyl-ACP dehydrogenase [Bradyrhizobium diazoefficiens]PDT62208.1 acyl-CoA dehydrogenase [Bradyrhizobium diazoefficiens]QBP19898.1 acyl-CoA dehydrogenase [Bradyrhizobium diazoefficiens]QLD46985.1 acyl-CoA/acyl-ACP dehydrogenase [Bradyrhizobium diazoefficiens]